MDIKGEGNLFKAQIEKIVDNLHIGKSEDNSIRITFNQQIYVNIPPSQSQDISESKAKEIATTTGATIKLNPAKYGLSYNLEKQLSPQELEILLAKAVVGGTGIAVSEYLKVSDYAKGEVVNAHKKNVENPDGRDKPNIVKNQIMQDTLAFVNKVWNWFPKWLQTPILILIVIAFAWLFIKGLLPQQARSPQPTPPTAIPDQGLGLQNGDFEEDLDHWERRWEPTIITLENATIVSFPESNISSSIRRTGRNSLYITNSGGNNWQIIYRQRILGLKPNTQYELTYYVKGSLNSKKSLWFKLDNAWNIEETEYYSDPTETYANWIKQSGIITTGDYLEEDFWLLSSDLCDLYLDDITFVEISEQ